MDLWGPVPTPGRSCITVIHEFTETVDQNTTGTGLAKFLRN